MNKPDNILKYFNAYDAVTSIFANAANQLAALEVTDFAERQTAFRKLLEAREAAIRGVRSAHVSYDRQTMSDPTVDPITGHPLPHGSPYVIADK